MNNKDQETKYLYWLCHIPLLGPISIKRMWEQFESFEAVYNIEGKQLKLLEILTEKSAEQFDQWKSKLGWCSEEYEALASKGIRFVCQLDESYPKRLLTVHAAPMGLYVRGELPKEELPTVAIVGARNCSNYGLQVAEYMGKTLSREGMQIISGLAHGIDGAGHRGALAADQKTFGVLGCGINICYPRENYQLYEHMIHCGGIISEYVPGEKPKPQNFPMRNRIISGLSDVIIIIEAKEKSGSLITAELGLEQGKEIFALPGRITDQLSQGCNRLIKEGANILTSASDIMEYLGYKNGKILLVPEKNPNGLAKNEKMVYSCLDLEPKFLEQIIDECGLTISECMSSLLDLELGGYAVQVSHHYYGKKL